MTALTSNMRRALHRMRGARPELGTWLGHGPCELPRSTARALERRGLVRLEGNRAYLTDAGACVAEDVHAAQQRLLHGDASGRSPT